LKNIKNILIRADSSSTIGTGHIMRDLVLASHYKDARITFATQELEGNINERVLEAGYAIEILNSNEIEELDKLIEKLEIDLVIIDHYGIDYKFEKKLKKLNAKLKILSFDDTYEKHYCDILLNHNIYADKKKYKDLVPKACELRCGSEYTLLRDEFIEAKKQKKQIKNYPTNIFIAMGGTDHLNISTQILLALDEVIEVNIDVVTTTTNPNLNELQKYIQGKTNIILHTNISNMAELMNKADLAIVTPSVTVNEILYMRTPFIAIQTADNQKEMHDYLIKNNYISFNEFNEKEFLNNFNTMFQRKKVV